VHARAVVVRGEGHLLCLRLLLVILFVTQRKPAPRLHLGFVGAASSQFDHTFQLVCQGHCEPVALLREVLFRAERAAPPAAPVSRQTSESHLHTLLTPLASLQSDPVPA